MKKIVLTGGPCGGKSTVMKALKEEFGDRLIVVPEVATIVLAGGFPVPGRDLEWSESWQDAFQAAVTPLQIGIEDSHALVAKNRGANVMVCDRGVLDGAAYTQGGVTEFCTRYGIDQTVAHERAVSFVRPAGTAGPKTCHRHCHTGGAALMPPLAPGA